MEKLNNILENSFIYGKLKQFFLFVLGAFRETFLYKMFFRKPSDDVYKDSIFGRLSTFFKKALLWIADVLDGVWLIKLLKKIFNINLKEIALSSSILKFFGLSQYKYSLAFLFCLLTLFSASFIPTMLVAGMCMVIFAIMFLEKDFKQGIINVKLTVTDMFIFLYMIAIFHARNVSEDIQRNEIFLIYTVFIGVYFVFRFYLSNAEKVKMALSAFTCSAIAVCGVGFIQFITGSYKTTKWTDTNIFSDIEGRLVATFENPNVLGEYLLLIIPIALAMFIITDKLIWKIIYGGIILGSAFCMVLTYSRGCWIGLILGILLFILMMYPKLLIPIGIAAPFAIFFIPESIITRITSIGNLQDGSSAFRVYLWRGTINMIKNIWPYGIGLGNNAFSDSYRPYAYEAVIAPHSHNTFLHVMCESGIFGFIIFVLLLYFILRQLFTTYREAECKSVKTMATAVVCAILALMVQAIFDNTMYNYRMYMMFFALLAMSSALYTARKEKI